ncbi:MAG: DNA ligase [Candidatus Heimdallarchaeota archaeon AB_125]|nr:MAG: DNA ligase [Candidatus Heimdallarchaeota archaeon AB_125]
MGRNGEKIFASINTTRELPFRTFLAAMGIEKLGTTMGKKLANSFSSFDELKASSVEKLMELEGISHITAKFIHDGVRETERYDDLFKNGIKIKYPERKQASFLGITDQNKTKVIKPMKIYITGKVEDITKGDLRDLVESKGIEWGSGVTKSLDYLVLAENPGEKRQEQATALGVKMIGWEEFKSKYID